MGDSPGLDFIFPGGDSVFYWPFFLLDVLLASVLLLLAIRWGGVGAAIAAAAGGVLASLIGLGSFLLMRASILPFAGLPIPVAFSKNTGMNSLLLWLDCLALGLLGFALWHGIRVLRGRERSPQSKRPLSSA
jgi:hypothetical protein